MIDPTEHEDLNPPDSAEPEAPEPEETVCDICMSENLTMNVGIIYCQGCHTPFCTHFASKTDPAFCVACLSDLTVTRNNITYERTTYNEALDITTTYRRRAKEIKIEGQSWLFLQRKVYTLGEAELDAAIEVHRNLLGLMIAEAERIRNTKIHRNANVKVSIPTPSTITKTVTTKETTKTSSTKVQAQTSSLLSAMVAKGTMTQAQADAIISAIKK